MVTSDIKLGGVGVFGAHSVAGHTFILALRKGNLMPGAGGGTEKMKEPVYLVCFFCSFDAQ